MSTAKFHYGKFAFHQTIQLKRFWRVWGVEVLIHLKWVEWVNALRSKYGCICNGTELRWRVQQRLCTYWHALLLLKSRPWADNVDACNGWMSADGILVATDKVDRNAPIRDYFYDFLSQKSYTWNFQCGIVVNQCGHVQVFEILNFWNRKLSKRSANKTCIDGALLVSTWKCSLFLIYQQQCKSGFVRFVQNGSHHVVFLQMFAHVELFGSFSINFMWAWVRLMLHLCVQWVSKKSFALVKFQRIHKTCSVRNARSANV